METYITATLRELLTGKEVTGVQVNGVSPRNFNDTIQQIKHHGVAIADKWVDAKIAKTKIKARSLMPTVENIEYTQKLLDRMMGKSPQKVV